MKLRWFRAICQSDRGAVAIEAAAIMSLISLSVLVVVPELVYQTRAMSQTSRATALTADLLGAQAAVMTDVEFDTAAEMARWAVEPLDSAKLAFRAQSFVRDKSGAVNEEWNRSTGSACMPDSASTADAMLLIAADDRSMIAVTLCYELPSLTGFMPDRTIVSQFWQAARRGHVK